MRIGGDLHNSINLQDLLVLGSARITNNGVLLSLGSNITACIYRTGKVQIYGVKNIDDVQIFWDKTLSILKEVMSFPNADMVAYIKYIVASEKLPYTLNPLLIVENFPNKSIEYEPELFPGLIWKFKVGTCLLFNSGNIVIAGPNTIEKIEEIIVELRNNIDKLFM